MSPMTETFTVVLRGYDRSEVDQMLADVDEALTTGSEIARAGALETLRKTRFSRVLRGYAVEEVDGAVQDRLRRLGGEPEPPRPPVSFTVVLRGYDMAEVDRLLSQADEAQASTSGSLRASARAALTTAVFGERLRGYSREQVDREIQRRLEDLQER
jgi:hypothetical protein